MSLRELPRTLSTALELMIISGTVDHQASTLPTEEKTQLTL
jgi:hypothetical protein